VKCRFGDKKGPMGRQPVDTSKRIGSKKSLKIRAPRRAIIRKNTEGGRQGDSAGNGYEEEGVKGVVGARGDEIL